MQVKFYPYKKGADVLAMLKGGTQSFGIVLTWELEVLAMPKTGSKKLPLQGGRKGFSLT